MDVAAARYSERMEEVNAYLTERRVPKGLRKQVRKQFDYFMEVRSAFDEDEIALLIQEKPNEQFEI